MDLARGGTQRISERLTFAGQIFEIETREQTFENTTSYHDLYSSCHLETKNLVSSHITTAIR